MHRTQLNLDDWQYEVLRSRALRERRSLSDLVREAIADYLGREQTAARRPLEAVRGIARDPEGAGRDHDRFLYTGPRSAQRRRG